MFEEATKQQLHRHRTLQAHGLTDLRNRRPRCRITSPARLKKGEPRILLRYRVQRVWRSPAAVHLVNLGQRPPVVEPDSYPRKRYLTSQDLQQHQCVVDQYRSYLTYLGTSAPK